MIGLLRRSYSDAVTFTRIIKIGQLEIDILKPTVRAGTSELHLTSLEQSLPHLLAANAGRVVTREEILDTPWGADGLRGGRQRRELRSLRAKLQNDRPARLELAEFIITARTSLARKMVHAPC